VPAPESTTESHIETFARMGMSKTDMISLVACGHTLGG
jgi:catalase (peroxidase I)